MQSKFKINGDHFLTDQSKLNYIENRIRKKALQHLKPCLRINSITFFSTIKNLFNYLEDIFNNLCQKKLAMEKF